MTFYTIPWNAMFAELSEDYLERSRLIAWRFACGWVVGITFSFLIFSYVFTATETMPQGQLNPWNYQPFAAALALTIAVGAFCSTLLTLDQVQYLPQPQAAHRRFSLWAFLEEVQSAARNRDFVILLPAVLASGVETGTKRRCRFT